MPDFSSSLHARNALCASSGLWYLGAASTTETQRTQRKHKEEDTMDAFMPSKGSSEGSLEVLLTIELKFRDELSAVGVREAVARLQQKVRKNHPDITRIFFASESLCEDQNNEEELAS